MCGQVVCGQVVFGRRAGRSGSGQAEVHTRTPHKDVGNNWVLQRKGYGGWNLKQFQNLNEGRNQCKEQLKMETNR